MEILIKKIKIKLAGIQSILKCKITMWASSAEALASHLVSDTAGPDPSASEDVQLDRSRPHAITSTGGAEGALGTECARVTFALLWSKKHMKSSQGFGVTDTSQRQRKFKISISKNTELFG